MRTEKNQLTKSNVQCDSIMDSYLMLDKHERIPLNITFHLLKCKKCRTQVRYLTMAQNYASQPLKISTPITDKKIDSILKAVNPKWSTENFKLKPVSMAKWIVCGILMIISMMTFTFLSDKINNSLFETTFYLIFGVFVTGYCALFIASNLDFFIKKMEKIPEL